MQNFQQNVPKISLQFPLSNSEQRECFLNLKLDSLAKMLGYVIAQASFRLSKL